MRAHWAAATPEQRRQATKPARIAHAVKELVDNWPELRPEQMAKLRSLLQQPGGGPDA
jgi:uncharacterized protein with WD repeat